MIMNMSNNQMNNMNINQVNMNNNFNQNNYMNNNIIELNNYKNENIKLKEQINKLQQENPKLNNKLLKANQMIINIQQKDFDYINQINDLKNKLNDLNKKISNDGNLKKYVDYNNIMVVHFISGDGRINHGIKCLATDTFAEVEEKLYQIYDEFRETNNIFLAKGNIVKRFKKMSENNIKNGDKIQLQNSEF